MVVTSSYAVEVIHINKMFKDTIKYYRNAIAYLIDIYNKEWDYLYDIKDNLERKTAAEKLIHNTKDNKAKYLDFDKNYYKFPSYLRRAAIAEALGSVSSYHSNLNNWIKNNKEGKEPKLAFNRNKMPVFYNKEMYKEIEDEPYKAHLKLFKDNDWKWVEVKLLPTDVKYINKYWNTSKASAPVLEKHYGKYCLRFAFEEKVDLSSNEIEDQTICSVDLGINSDAVCSIMNSTGTVLARKFINFPSEKDQIDHIVNRIKKHQREYSNNSVRNLWTYAKRLNTEHANDVAAAIVKFAAANKVDCIVFEYLDMQGRKHGNKKQKLTLWRKNTIQNTVTHKAHRLGIHVSHICAWGTSKLAFDGSGEVQRDTNNYSLCTFTNGKQYNCDLSASYNIGSRYFIRELLKPLSATKRSLIQAKVPELERRTLNTLSTLLLLNKELNSSLKTA